MDNDTKKVIVVGHIDMNAEDPTLHRIIAENGLKEEDVIIVGSKKEIGFGIVKGAIISNHSIQEQIKANPDNYTLKSKMLQLIEPQVEEAKELAQIIEEDRERGLVITASHRKQDAFQRKVKVKKPYWKNGKLRNK